MKIRKYIIEEFGKNVYFCPNCHRQIFLPFKGEVKLGGALKINCGNCKGGQISIELIKE